MHDPDRKVFPEGSINEAFGDQSSTFFEKIVSIAPSILYVFDLVEMRNIWVNRSMYLGLGYSPQEVTDMGANLLQTLMHPEDLERYPEHFAVLQNLKPDDVARFEYRMKGKNGHWHWLVSEEMAFSYGSDGKVTQIVGSAHDVTEARTREERINLLVREMHHRIKNLFTVVLSMISLTSKTKREAPTQEAFETIQGRVNALAVSQSLSMPTAVEAPSSFHDLVELILKPYVATHDIEVVGAEPFISSDQARSLAMILHELATNAIKYGSLSQSGGHLKVNIDVLTEDDGESTVELIWEERASFEMSEDAIDNTKGFGAKLILRSVEQIDGEIHLDWRKTGLFATVKFPVIDA